MKPYNTQYSKEYNGENAHADLNSDFYKLIKEIDDLGIPQRKPKIQPYFKKERKNLIAEEVVLLADEMPLAEVYLRGIKWGDKKEKLPIASLSMSIRHFKGSNPIFPKLEELAKEFNLQSRGTHQRSGC